MLITQLQSNVQDRGALDLPQVQEVQERFDKYRELAAAQLEEAKGKISRLEHQLDDRIIEADMAQNKAKEEMREREKERLEAVRRESDAVQAAAGVNLKCQTQWDTHMMIDSRQWESNVVVICYIVGSSSAHCAEGSMSLGAYCWPGS